MYSTLYSKSPIPRNTENPLLYEKNPSYDILLLMKDTPLIRQYNEIKKQYPDKIVLFRMGDFYETFGEDAKITSKILNITLTKRNKNEDQTPLAGFPYHALDQYVPKIIESGKCAVIVDQLEDPAQAKGIVRRGVTKIITPGTLEATDEQSGKSRKIVSIVEKKGRYGICVVDIYTGMLQVIEITKNQSELRNIIVSYEPSEILLEEEGSIRLSENIPVQLIDKSISKKDKSEDILLNHFKVHSLHSLGLDNEPVKISTIALSLHYIKETQQIDPQHIKKVQIVDQKGRMILDESTIRSLELIPHLTVTNSDNSLYSIINETETSMGARLLRSWLLNPLTEKKPILERQKRVDVYYKDYERTLETKKILSTVNDIDRLASKIGLSRITPKEFIALKDSIEASLQIIENEKLEESLDKESLKEIVDKISKTISKEAPHLISEGNIIADNYNQEVDE
ncbi:MAG TPA: hypothetical protein ENN64_00935, partial [bacterium]|nr:hypothetical protein [bacterium]